MVHDGSFEKASTRAAGLLGIDEFFSKALAPDWRQGFHSAEELRAAFGRVLAAV